MSEIEDDYWPDYPPPQSRQPAITPGAVKRAEKAFGLRRRKVNDGLPLRECEKINHEDQS